MLCKSNLRFCCNKSRNIRAEQFFQASYDNGLIAIPAAEYATKIAPQQWAQQFNEHVQATPDDYSPAQARDIISKNAAELKAEFEQAMHEASAGQAFADEVDALKTQISQQLMATGRHGQQTADANATAFAAYFATRAQQLGTQPQALFEASGLSIAPEGGFTVNQEGLGQRTNAPSAPSEAIPAEALNAMHASYTQRGGEGDINESTNIEAKSDAFAAMAQSLGYTVTDRGGKYFDAVKDFGKDEDGYDREVRFSVRVSDHSNVNRSQHYGTTHINIAPDDGWARDTFEQAYWKLKHATPDDEGYTGGLINGESVDDWIYYQASQPDAQAAELQRQFDETAQALGGQAAYDAAKAAGKTKLNYRQWVQVRTPNFKAWFGDWEAGQSIRRANAQIQQWFEGTLAANVVIGLGRPSQVLAMHGVPNLPITLKQSILRKATDGKHGIDKASLSDLAGAIQNPLAIFDDADHPNTRVVLTEVRSADGNVIAALRLNQSRDGLEINDVRSVHPKRDESILHWVNEGLLLGVDKNKGRTWLENLAATHSQQPQALATLDDILYDGTSLSNASKVIDPETGEPLVVYHGRHENFNVFDERLSGGVFYFSSDRAYADEYGDPYGKVSNVEAFLSAGNVLDLRNLTSITPIKFLEALKAKGVVFSENTAEAVKGKIGAMKGSHPSWYYLRILSEGGLVGDIRRAGFDAVQQMESTGTGRPLRESFAVFTPNQIKSATGNTGAFDGGNANILYQSAQQDIDAQYLAAIERGDMETAKQLVHEAAQQAGYDPTINYRMSHSAPNKQDNPSLLEARETGLVPDDYWTHPQYYLSSPEEREALSKINTTLRSADARKAAGKNPSFALLTVYRAIPKDVKDGAFRNGDWVTPSLSYAKLEGAEIKGGYRIISKSVSIKDIYWDGNSIAELGYDDGNNYAYRNTKNNRKLLDPITRNEAGEIIPLSQRFKARNPSVYYQSANNATTLEEQLEQAQRVLADARARGEQAAKNRGAAERQLVAELEANLTDDEKAFVSGELKASAERLAQLHSERRDAEDALESAKSHRAHPLTSYQGGEPSRTYWTHIVRSVLDDDAQGIAAAEMMTGATTGQNEDSSFFCP